MTVSLVRYWHTLRYLKPVQVTGRAQHVLFRSRLPAADRLETPGVRRPVRPLVPAIARRPSMTGPHQFKLLNEAGALRDATDWNSPAKAKLWLYNLHYFDDLNARNASCRVNWHRALMERWIADNPPGAGNGWEPYPLSLRIVNWVKWALAGNVLAPAARDSLYLQAEALARKVEWHLLGNHLLANAKGLVFAGLFFSGPAAEALASRGIAIYRDQLDEQILADGGHFELSPMYHALLLEDLLDLINLDAAYGHRLEAVLRRKLEGLAARMLGWLAVMTHPDGEIALFNDAAFAIAGTPADLAAYAARLGIASEAAADIRASDGLTHLAASGYLRVEKADAVAFLDGAAIGPDYLPGHAHADTLSFELSLASERVIVNGGTSVYGTGAERLRQRGTPAHSTVSVDGADSSEMWSGFRVARRARVMALSASAGAVHEVSASHDGYRRLRGRNIHSRTWRMDEYSLTIDDQVSGAHRSAVARFHLAPGARLIAEPGNRIGRLVTIGGRMLSWQASEPAAITWSSWHPEFGVYEPTRCLDVPLAEGRATTIFRW
jgi:uncharacterized heparinase superfamily protein